MPRTRDLSVAGHLTYEWDFGDGITEGPGGPDEFRSAEHTYTVDFPAVITVSLRVTDSTGLCSIVSSPSIVVKPSTVVPSSGGNAGGGGNTQPTPTLAPIATCPMLSPLMMGLTLLGLFGMRMGHGRRQRP